eukprot:4844650-Alexandrium_andersonii.AAC.1
MCIRDRRMTSARRAALPHRRHCGTPWASSSGMRRPQSSHSKTTSRPARSPPRPRSGGGRATGRP